MGKKGGKGNRGFPMKTHGFNRSWSCSSHYFQGRRDSEFPRWHISKTQWVKRITFSSIGVSRHEHNGIAASLLPIQKEKPLSLDDRHRKASNIIVPYIKIYPVTGTDYHINQPSRATLLLSKKNKRAGQIRERRQTPKVQSIELKDRKRNDRCTGALNCALRSSGSASLLLGERMKYEISDCFSTRKL
ncbi:9981_t:CDS:2 [Acaulospora morrowiae]|uniref:9981_t:CDS:1 n=1 Tax=Acaulospora morrowiae TaxID=94023 RepID=A0A9N8VF89_9GLOM|nr:9981_t:CDS:2 [Acaulospora morrowiae]